MLTNTFSFPLDKQNISVKSAYLPFGGGSGGKAP